MFRIGDKVRIKVSGVGFRKGKIVDTGLNSFWVEYNSERYLVARVFLERWNKESEVK